MELIDKDYIEKLKQSGNWGKPAKRRAEAVSRAVTIIRRYGDDKLISTMDAQAFGLYPPEITVAIRGKEINHHVLRADGEYRTHCHAVVDQAFVEWLWNRSWGPAYPKQTKEPLPDAALDVLTDPKREAKPEKKAGEASQGDTLDEIKQMNARWTKFGYSITQAKNGTCRFADYNEDPVYLSQWFRDLDQLEGHLRAYNMRKKRKERGDKPRTPRRAGKPRQTSPQAQKPQVEPQTVATLANGGRQETATIKVSAMRRFFARLAGVNLPKTVEVPIERK